ncbi:glycosyltransferase family 2 protein [Acidobacteria bacterium AH-259-L09]|nr:glycosyltransferase family 2 protein [Acidobacteria bacterium AH-259-L09]
MRKVSVIVPVYYNEESLPLLFSELLKVENKLRQQNLELEVIFVDDGSGDASLNELLKIKQQRESTRVIKLTRNFGAIHAAKTGLQFITGDCFVLLAADLQDPPELIPEMVQLWQHGAKYVLCARADRIDPLWAKLFAKIYYWLLRLFVLQDYPPGGYDLALMDRAFLPYLRDSAKNINTSLFAYWLGFKPEIIHYKRKHRFHGHSRWTFSKKIKLFLDSILGFSIVPIRTILAIGILVSLVSFSYGSVIVIHAILGRTDVPGFATIAALLSFLLGLMIVMLGIIGEYIWRIFDEINERPESVIEEIY